MEPTLGALLARIERVETANARLRTLVMLAFAFFAVIGFTAAASSGPMTVRGTNGHRLSITGDYIEFLDSAGKTRARFGISNVGNAQLLMNDSAGTERTYLGRFTDGSYGLSLDDRSGTERAYLGLSSADNPQLTLKDKSKTDRVYAGSYSSGKYGVAVYDSSGSSIWGSP
jgi:hypothetical protein